jgi:hypothetical protein
MGKETKELLNQIDANVKLILKHLKIQTKPFKGKEKRDESKQGAKPVTKSKRNTKGRTKKQN